MSKRLTDRYAALLLEPGSPISAVVAQLGLEGAVFHLLSHAPDQGEDGYVVLVEDQWIAEFEIDRASNAVAADSVRIRALQDYRDAIGQGRRRMRLDRAVADARALGPGAA